MGCNVPFYSKNVPNKYKIHWLFSSMWDENKEKY